MEVSDTAIFMYLLCIVGARRYNPNMNNEYFMKTFVEYLAEPLRADWVDLVPTICKSRCRLMVERAMERDFATQRALGWLENAEHSADPHVAYVAGRMMASVMGAAANLK